MSEFYERLKKVWNTKGLLCIGLDSDVEKIPEQAAPNSPEVYRQAEFNGAIVTATHGAVGFYKPNLAFYEGTARYMQSTAITALGLQIAMIREKSPDTVIISDAKRGDIGNTNKGYAKGSFDILDADAVTVNPYFGVEAMAPFLDRADKGVIILCKTSNPGSGEFQDLPVTIHADKLSAFLDKGPQQLEQEISDGEGHPEYEQWVFHEDHVKMPFYQYVAIRVANAWNKNKNCALVVGATYPKELGIVRKLVGDEIPILVPGIGAQGGDLRATLENGLTAAGDGLIISNSSGIIFKSKGKDYAEAANQEAVRLQEEINRLRKELRPNAA